MPERLVIWLAPEEISAPGLGHSGEFGRTEVDHRLDAHPDN